MTTAKTQKKTSKTTFKTPDIVLPVDTRERPKPRQKTRVFDKTTELEHRLSSRALDRTPKK